MRENRSLVAGSYRSEHDLAVKRQHREFFGNDGTILYPDCGGRSRNLIDTCVSVHTAAPKGENGDNMRIFKTYSMIVFNCIF